jgi:signal transduction histidine kinase
MRDGIESSRYSYGILSVEDATRLTQAPDRTSLEVLADVLERQQEAIVDQWFAAACRDPLLRTHPSARERFATDLPHLYARLRAHVRNIASTSRKPTAQQRPSDGPGDGDGHHQRPRDELNAIVRAIEIFARVVLSDSLTRFAHVEPTPSAATEIEIRAGIHQFFEGLLDEALQQSSCDRATLDQSFEARLAIAKAELERTSSQRQRLMAVVAHELRNFVQGLSYVAQLWEKQPDNKKALQYARAQIRDMHDLLQLLLEHSTLVDARQAPALEPFDVQALCEEIAVVYQHAAEQKGLQLRHECESAPELVFADRVRIKQIISNLLSNAIKYTSQGEVALHFRVHDERYWEVHVTDTGPGISNEQAARLLSGLGGDETLPGRGIGLGITRDLVRMLGGTIELISATGEGSRFIVRLPGRIPNPGS